jgi:hypothetical protein
MNAPVLALRPTYTVDQFAAEALGGNRSLYWVRQQCRLGKIKTVGRRPFLIPQSEALRFAGREGFNPCAVEPSV